MRNWLVALAVFGCLARPSVGEDPQIPAENRANPAVGNGLSPDNRIHLRAFHAIFFFDSEHPNHGSALNNEAALKFLFDNFNAQAELDADKNFRFMPFGMKFFPVAHILDREKATEANLNALIAKLSGDTVAGVKQGDVVFFWGEAEGATGADGRVKLRTSDGKTIDRQDLIHKLEFHRSEGGRRTHLTVVITDNCQTSSIPDVKVRVQPEEPKIWRALYFGHSGTVDIASSSASSPAFAAGGQSLFVAAFMDTFNKEIVNRSNLLDPSGFVTWRNFADRVPKEADRIYDEVLQHYYEYDKDKDGRPTGMPKAATTPAYGLLSADQQTNVSLMRDSRIAGRHRPTFNLSEVHVNPGSH